MPNQINSSDEIEFEKIASEEADKEIDLAPYKINTYGADYTLEILSDKLDRGEIEVPDFQRKYVWPEKKASKLIESFLLGLPVPQIFLYRTEDQKLLVVDGQQRLRSINYFFKGNFGNSNAFLLSGVKNTWNNKSFEQLIEQDKRRLKNAVLRATIFEQTDPADHTSIFEVFQRLNTGGMALVEQEVRNCVIRGKINQFLKELNEDKNWRSLLGKNIPDARMRDIEMILRFFALFYNWEKYRKPMKDFVTTFMRENKDFQKQLREKDGDLFQKTMAFIKKEVGKNAFKLKAGINIALFDSVSVALAKTDIKDIKNVKIKYKLLKKDSDYLEKISKSTTDIDRVQDRIKMAMNKFAK